MTDPTPNPEDDLIVTAPELAKWLALSDRAVRELAEDQIITRAGRGVYPLMKSIQQYCSRLREVAAGRKSGRSEGEDGPDLVAERARLAKAQADMQEMQNDLFEGSVVTVEGVTKAVIEDLTIVRTTLLAMPSMIAPAVHRAKTVAETEAAIRAGVHDALTALSDDARDYIPKAPPSPPGRMRGPGKRRPATT